MENFNNKFLDDIKQRAICSVRAGKEREKFTGIWMVVVNDRVFARSYYLSELSWFTTFLKDGFGSIKCGNTIVEVQGIKPKDLVNIKDNIHEAYQSKYGLKAYNKKWIEGFIQPDRVERTMEFVPA